MLLEGELPSRARKCAIADSEASGIAAARNKFYSSFLIEKLPKEVTGPR